jgi:hypothetical protein
MPVIEERYDQNKVDGLKRYLKREAEKGRGKDFEIIVDGFKVVSRTDDADEFDAYEDEVKDNTRNVSILVYDGHGTNRNTRYSFSLNHDGMSPIPSSPVNGLGTLADIDEIIQQRLDEKDREYKISSHEKELLETKQKLFEAEEYKDQLQQRILDLEDEKGEKPKPNQFSLNLGELGASLVSGLLKKNAPQLAGLLNGILPQENQAEAEPQGAATFQKQESGTAMPQMSESQVRNLNNLQLMEQTFDEQQLQIAMVILRTLIKNPDQLLPVAQFLNLHNSDEQI